MCDILIVVQGRLRRNMPSQSPEFSFLRLPSLSFLFRWVIFFCPYSSLPHHILISGKGLIPTPQTLICFNQGSVAPELDPSGKSNKPCRVSRSVTHWESEEIGVLMGQCPFSETKNYSKWMASSPALLAPPFFRISVLLLEWIGPPVSSEAKALELCVESISYQGCKNQKPLWSPCTENCFCLQASLRQEMTGPF